MATSVVRLRTESNGCSLPPCGGGPGRGESPTRCTWQNTEWLGEDVVAKVRELKAGDGPTLLVQGSGVLLQTLLTADLLDEIRLLIYPLVLGSGKRFFGEGTMPAALRLTGSTTTPSGVLITRYERAGEVQTGSFAMETPTAAEVERRKERAPGLLNPLGRATF